MARWIELTTARLVNADKLSASRPGQQGVSRAAATELGVNAKDAQRAVKVASLSPEAKDAALGHGHFLKWIEAEFGMSDQSAANFMNVTKNFGGKIPNGLEFAPTALYALAAPSTPRAYGRT